MRFRDPFRCGWAGCLLSALMISSSFGQEAAKPETPPPLTKTTHVYKTVGEVKISADVYRPAGMEPRPVVVWIHGGALILGSRSQVPKNILELCTKEKLIFISLDYRLAPEVKLPEIAADLKDAFRWINEQGPKLFQADTSRIVVTGGSAGGFLTMLSGAVVKPRPAALVAYWGYGDIDGRWATSVSEHYRDNTPLVEPKEALAAVHQGKVLTNTDDPAIQKGRGLYYRYLRQTGGWSREVTGIDVAKQPGKLDQYCPLKLITPDYPPILMVHGTADTDVPYHCSTDMAKELAKHGVKLELVTVPNAEHGLRDGDPKLVVEAHAQALVFILQHARTKPATVEEKRVEALLEVIAHVGPQGAGSIAARGAQQELSKRGIEILPPLLVAMDTPNVVAANWYRLIYDQIVTRERKRSNVVWPVAFLKEYVNDARRAGRPRRLVLALLDQFEPQFSATWFPTRLTDPAFRHEAVTIALKAGEQALKDKDNARAKAEFQQAFEHARDSAQVVQAADKLRSLGETPDVISHLGLVVDWWLVGPFDAPEKTGFAKTFPPEQKVDLTAKFQGQAGGEIGWFKHRSTDALGQLNLLNAVSSTREAVAYAYTEIDVPREQHAQLGCGADDNCTVWLNGRKVLGRDQWLNGTRFDRFVTPITLKAGRNTLLVKICQGPQHKDPEVPNNWSLQLRLCDDQGKGIPFKPIQ